MAHKEENPSLPLHTAFPRALYLEHAVRLELGVMRMDKSLHEILDRLSTWSRTSRQVKGYGPVPTVRERPEATQQAEFFNALKI